MSRLCVYSNYIIAHARDKNITTESTEVLTENTKQLQELTLTKNTEKSLKEEILRLREFGQVLNESYEQLKTKYQTKINEQAADKEIIQSLEDQIKRLTQLLSQTNIDNKNLKKELGNFDEVILMELKQKNNELIEENIILRKEKEGLEKLLTEKYQEKEIFENEKANTNKLIQQLNAKVKVLIITIIVFEIGVDKL